MSLSLSPCAAEVMLPSRSARFCALNLRNCARRYSYCCPARRGMCCWPRSALGRGLVRGSHRLLLGEIGGELVHLLVAQIRRHRRHLRVFPVALAKLEQLDRDRLF